MNDRVLDTDDTALVDADEWAELEPSAAPLDVSAELQRQVDEFLASGGRIKTFEPGESAIPTNQSLWSFPVGKSSALSCPVKREEGQQRRLKAQSKSQKRGSDAKRATKHSDTELVAMIPALFGVAKSKKEMMNKLGVSDSLLQRLLFSHFPGDNRADPYRAISRGDREALRVRQIRDCLEAGNIGVQNISQLTGIRMEVLIDLNRKFGLKIPVLKPGRRGSIACANELCHALVTTTAKYCPQCGTITDLGTRENAK